MAKSAKTAGENGQERIRSAIVQRWTAFRHRGTKLAFVVSQIVVEARDPAELEANTDREIIRRTKDGAEN